MNWISGLTLGLSALGGMLSNKGSANTSTTGFTIPPQYQRLVDALYNKYLTNFYNPAPAIDMSGYEANSASNINNVFDLLKMNRNNNLTARGLGTSPIAGISDEYGELQRGSELARMQNQIPILKRQFAIEDEQLQNQNIMSLLQMLSGRQVTYPNMGMTGGLVSGLANYGAMQGW